jgi:hypothetical protein
MIKTKTELLAAMKANPALRLYGHMGARPASPWKYKLRDEVAKTDIDTVSSVAVNALHVAESLHTVRSSWQYGVYRLTAAARA